MVKIYWTTIVASMFLGIWTIFWALVKSGIINQPSFDTLVGLFLLSVMIIILIREKTY